MKAGRIATFLLLILSACYPPRTQENPKHENKTTARINLETEPSTLDPRKTRDLNAVVLSQMLFEGLVAINPEGEIENSLAETIAISENQTVYTFTLRKSTWSNGDPITAEDFVYAWKSVLNPSFAADNAFQLFAIKGAKAAKNGTASFEEVGIHALDASTLEIILECPVSHFLQLLTLPIFFPINAQVDQENPEWAYNAATFVNNGPFSLDTWQHNDHITLKKNGMYWDASHVQLQEITLTMVSEETALKMFEKKELDWIGSPFSTLPSDALAHLKKQGKLKEKSFLGTCFIRCNTDYPLLSNKKMRQALARSMNRTELTTHVLQGGQIPSTALIPSVMSLHATPYFQDGNVQEARFLFSEAIQELGLTEPIELTLIYTNDIRKHLLAQALQQQWEQALGIKVKLEANERKVYFDRIAKKDFIMSIGDWIADFYDPINFLEVFKYKALSTNSTGWENSEYIHLLDASIKQTEEKKRRNFLLQSESILIESMPIIPIFEHRLLYMHNDYLEKIELTSTGRFCFKGKPL